MIMEAFVLDVSTFDRSLNAAIAANPFAIPTSPVDRILVSIVDPIFVVFVN